MNLTYFILHIIISSIKNILKYKTQCMICLLQRECRRLQCRPTPADKFGLIKVFQSPHLKSGLMALKLEVYVWKINKGAKKLVTSNMACMKFGIMLIKGHVTLFFFKKKEAFSNISPSQSYFFCQQWCALPVQIGLRGTN